MSVRLSHFLPLSLTPSTSFLSPSFALTVCLSVCLSVSQSVCLSLPHSFSLSPLSLFLSLFLSICLSLSLDPVALSLPNTSHFPLLCPTNHPSASYCSINVLYDSFPWKQMENLKCSACTNTPVSPMKGQLTRALVRLPVLDPLTQTTQYVYVRQPHATT